MFWENPCPLEVNKFIILLPNVGVMILKKIRFRLWAFIKEQDQGPEINREMKENI